MAANVTLTGTIVFDVLLSLVKDIGVEVLDLQFESLAAFVGPYVTNIIDRSFNTA